MNPPNMLQRISHAIRSANGYAPEQKAAIGHPPALSPQMMMFFDMMPPSASSEGSNLTRRLAYRHDNLAFACMQFRSVKLVEAPLWIVDETDDGEEWLKGEHELSAVLEQPNPDQDISEFLTQISLLMDIDGQALIVKAGDRSGRIAQLWVYNQDQFTVERAPGRLYGRFRVNTENGQETLSPDDVIYLREPHPTDPYQAISRVGTALSKINLSQDLVTTIRQILRRGVNPGGIFGFKEALTSEQKESVRGEIKANLAGVHNAGGAMVLDGEVSYTSPVISLKDMTTGPAQYDCEAAICQAFQVHPILVGAKVGMESNSGLSDSIAPALKLYYDVAARPQWRKIERKLTAGLLRPIDNNPRRFIRFDTTKVQALQETMLERAKTVDTAREVLTVDEGRIYLGYDALEDDRGDKLIAETSRPEIDPSLLGGFGADEPPAKGEKRKRVRSSTDQASRHIVWLGREAMRNAHEFTIQIAAQSALIEDREAIRQLLHVEQKAEALTEAAISGILAKIVHHLKTVAEERWRKLLRPPVLAAGRHAVQQAAAELGVSFNLLQPGLLEFIDREIGFLITKVNETTRDAVRRAILDGFKAGESLDGIAQRIADLGAFTVERAELIARTETTRALNGSQRESLSKYAQESGARATKSWLSQRDDKVRPEHESLDGQKRPVDEAFSNGLQEPSEPNCRCYLLFSLEEAA